MSNNKAADAFPPSHVIAPLLAQHELSVTHSPFRNASNVWVKGCEPGRLLKHRLLRGCSGGSRVSAGDRNDPNHLLEISSWRSHQQLIVISLACALAKILPGQHYQINSYLHVIDMDADIGKARVSGDVIDEGHSSIIRLYALPIDDSIYDYAESRFLALCGRFCEFPVPDGYMSKTHISSKDRMVGLIKSEYDIYQSRLEGDEEQHDDDMRFSGFNIPHRDRRS